MTATHDGTTVTVGVTEAGTPRGGTARGGDFVAQDNGAGAIAGWTGARFRRGEAAEYLVAYTDVGPPESMAFVPENLNKLNEVSGLTGETVPESGLAIETAWLPVIVSTSLAAAGPRGSVTYGPTGTGNDQGLAFAGTFGGDRANTVARAAPARSRSTTGACPPPWAGPGPSCPSPTRW